LGAATGDALALGIAGIRFGETLEQLLHKIARMGPFCLVAQVEDSFLSWIRVPVSTRVDLFGFLKY
jgi:hypothetical protein